MNETLFKYCISMCIANKLPVKCLQHMYDMREEGFLINAPPVVLLIVWVVLRKVLLSWQKLQSFVNLWYQKRWRIGHILYSSSLTEWCTLHRLQYFSWLVQNTIYALFFTSTSALIQLKIFKKAFQHWWLLNTFHCAN